MKQSETISNNQLIEQFKQEIAAHTAKFNETLENYRRTMRRQSEVYEEYADLLEKEE